MFGLAAGSGEEREGLVGALELAARALAGRVSADEEPGFAADVLLQDVEGETAAAAFLPVALDCVAAADRSAFRRKHEAVLGIEAG